MSQNRPRERADAKRKPRPPGRPLRLTDELQLRIVTYVRAGAFQGAAAEACGVPERTFYEWLARGRGTHLTRRPTPQLRAFAQAVDQAAAEARMAVEIRVYREHPRFWLTRAARSKPGSEGWTELKAQGGGGDSLAERILQWHAEGIHPSD